MRRPGNAATPKAAPAGTRPPYLSPPLPIPPPMSPDLSYPGTEHLQARIAGSVLRLTLDRPAKKNALTRAMYAGLADALEQAAHDPAVRVVLVQGTGGVFTAGNDLGDFMMDPPADESSPVFRFLRVVSTFEKPLVAAVAGPAVGIGTTLLLHCDLVYCAPDARLQMPFVPLGLAPEAASSLLLPRAVGQMKAAEWLLFGEPFSGDDAFAAGLVTALVAADEVDAHAAARAETLAALPPASVRLTKRLLRQPDASAVQHTIRDEGAHFVQRLQSEEAAEALSAFFEKRKPDFSRFS